MTDGIIQEVFRKHLSLYDYPIGERLHYAELQKKLIKKIKQTISEHYRCACVDTDEITLALIGDNNAK